MIASFYWINQARGNYRCNKCGFQYHDGQPGAHMRAHVIVRAKSVRWLCGGQS